MSVTSRVLVCVCMCVSSRGVMKGLPVVLLGLEDEQQAQVGVFFGTKMDQVYFCVKIVCICSWLMMWRFYIRHGLWTLAMYHLGETLWGKKELCAKSYYPRWMIRNGQFNEDYSHDWNHGISLHSVARLPSAGHIRNLREDMKHEYPPHMAFFSSRPPDCLVVCCLPTRLPDASKHFIIFSSHVLWQLPTTFCSIL